MTATKEDTCQLCHLPVLVHQPTIYVRNPFDATGGRYHSSCYSSMSQTQRVSDLEAALGQLVKAKDEKDKNGETELYRSLKQGAWERAREVLNRTKHAT